MDAIRSKRQPSFRRDGQQFHFHGWTLVDAATQPQRDEPLLEILEDVEENDPRLYPQPVLNADEFGWEIPEDVTIVRPLSSAPSTGELEELRGELETAKASIADLETKLEAEKVAHQKVSEQHREQKADLADLKREKKALETELAKITAERDALRSPAPTE